jgi:hypothetical protein
MPLLRTWHAAALKYLPSAVASSPGVCGGFFGKRPAANALARTITGQP